MPKLITPVQYEPSLDGLNELRPLILSDDVKTVLDIPILDVIPANEDRSAIGKLLRCDDGGSLVSKNDSLLENVEIIAVDFGYYSPELNVEFAQKVSGVMWQFLTETDALWIRWVASGNVCILELSLCDKTWLPFVGTKLRINFDIDDIAGCIHGLLYGFY